MSACVLCLIFLTSVAHAQQQTPPPALPLIAADRFDPPVRGQILKAYGEAEARPGDAEASGRLGMLLQTYEQYEAAAACFERASAVAPQEPRWKYYAGIVRAAQGDNARAVENFDEVFKRRPDFGVVRLRLADGLFAANRLDESERLYRAALAAANKPAAAASAANVANVAAAHYGLGRTLAARRDLNGAIEYLTRATELVKGYGTAHYALALAYRDLGDVDRAKQQLALYRTAERARPPLEDELLEAVESLNVSAAELLKKGVEFDRAGRLDLAIDAHERAAAAPGAQLAQTHVNLILLYHRAGFPDKAAESYRAALKIDPQSAEAHYNYGVVLTERGDFAGAAAAFSRAVEINPYLAEANHNYAALLEREGKLAEAAKYYRAAIDNKPNYRLAHFHLARILASQNNLTEAAHHLRQTLTPEDESTARYTYALAVVYARAGDPRRALDHMRTARRLAAAAANQTDLLKLIERDLLTLEKTSGR